MRRLIALVVGAAVVMSVATPPANASKVSQLGGAVTYPAKKIVKSTKHDASHPVKSVTSPINQAGQTTTRTFHKITK
jgi:hypothetical protein